MNIGFIGLGTMGGPMALNAQSAGHPMRVHDLRQTAAAHLVENGATWAASVREVGAHSDIVFTSLPGPREVEAVAAELIECMQPGTTWFDLSTNSPTVIRRLHAEFATKNIALLDAPVSGGPTGAKSRKLALWVGGDPAVFEQHRAMVAKLVHNCAGYAIQTALAEVFTMGVKAGVPALDLWAAVRQGSLGRIRTFDRLGKQFLQGSFEPPEFALKLAHKDVALACELGREMSVPMRVANLAYADMTEALNREGWGALDSRVPMLLQEERAGVSIKVAAEEIQAVIKREG
jgi:3-hydroxyisobutyrate dehydrogenase